VSNLTSTFPNTIEILFSLDLWGTTLPGFPPVFIVLFLIVLLKSPLRPSLSLLIIKCSSSLLVIPAKIRFFFLNVYLLTYLAVPNLSCRMQVFFFFLVEACQLLVAACGNLIP